MLLHQERGSGVPLYINGAGGFWFGGHLYWHNYHHYNTCTNGVSTITITKALLSGIAIMIKMTGETPEVRSDKRTATAKQQLQQQQKQQ